MKMKTSELIKGAIPAKLFLCVLWLATVCGCGFSLYEERIVKRANSPNGEKIAVVYEGGAGATGGNSSSVNIFESSEVIATTSNQPVFDGSVFSINENPEIDLSWKSPNELEIQYLAPKEWQIIEYKRIYLGVTVSLRHIEGMPKPPGQRN